jgi:hypothetical protein
MPLPEQHLRPFRVGGRVVSCESTSARKGFSSHRNCEARLCRDCYRRWARSAFTSRWFGRRNDSGCAASTVVGTHRAGRSAEHPGRARPTRDPCLPGRGTRSLHCAAPSTESPHDAKQCRTSRDSRRVERPTGDASSLTPQCRSRRRRGERPRTAWALRRLRRSRSRAGAEKPREGIC